MTQAEAVVQYAIDNNLGCLTGSRAFNVAHYGSDFDLMTSPIPHRELETAISNIRIEGVQLLNSTPGLYEACVYYHFADNSVLNVIPLSMEKLPAWIFATNAMIEMIDENLIDANTPKRERILAFEHLVMAARITEAPYVTAGQSIKQQNDRMKEKENA